MPARVDFAGLTPGFIGLGQVNLVIPENAPAGDAIPIVILSAGIRGKERAACDPLGCCSLCRSCSPQATCASLPAAIQVTLRLPPDGLYAREEMQIEFRVQDTSRPDPLTDFAPVIRATPEAVIEMPEMPGMPKFTETAHAEGVPGDYGIHPTFAHGGAYRLKLAIHPPAADAFTVEFPLEVLDGKERRKTAAFPVHFGGGDCPQASSG